MSFTGNHISFFFFSLVLLRPDAIVLLPTLDTIVDYMRILVFLILILQLLIKPHHISFLLLLGSIYAVILFSTIIHEGDLYRALVFSATVLCVPLLGVVSARNIGPLLDSWYVLFSLLIFANFFTILTFPDGLYRTQLTNNPVYLLGHRNTGSALSSVMAGFMIFRSYYIYNRVTVPVLAIIIITYISIILVWSATVLVSFTVCLLFIFILTKMKSVKIINIYTVMGASILVSLLLIVFRRQDIFRYFIEVVLQRDLTITGRIYVWDEALYYISKSPWIGWGVVIEELLFSVSAHNAWLDKLCIGGCVAVTIFLIVILVYGRNMHQHKTKAGKVLLCIAIFYGIWFIAEPFSGSIEGLLYVALIFSCTLKESANKSQNPKFSPIMAIISPKDCYRQCRCNESEESGNHRHRRRCGILFG